MEPSWGLDRAPCFRGASVRNPSLDSNLGNNNNNNSLGNNLGEDRQALGDCPQPASSMRFLTAWEKARSGEQKLTQNPHFTQLRAEVDTLKECIGHLVRLLDSFHRESPVQNLHVGEQACTDKFVQTNGAEQDPKGEHSRVDVSKHKQKQLEQQTQEQKEGEGTSEEETSEQKRPKQHNNNSLGTQQINSLGREDHEQERCMYQIMVDTGAETSVAPRSFADHVQLSFPQNDLELRGADGNKISIYGTRRVELVTVGFSFQTCFVIADVERPLLGLQSLLQNNLSLQIDSSQGHQLVNTEGEKIPLQQLGHQIFLAACPLELELTSSMIGILQNKSLMPEDKVGRPGQSFYIGKHKEMPKEGGATSSFTFETFVHRRQQQNKTAIGQQTALPKPAKNKKKKLGQQWAANKLRPWAKTRIINEIQLALLNPKQDPKSLDHNTAQEMSFRVVLTWSLMNKWQLLTIRIQKAQPQEEILGHLRKLGLDQCSLDTQLLLGDHLFVMLDGNSLLIGGQDQEQECFLTELSALMTLESPTKLAEGTPLTFLGKSVELNQAERSISLQLPLASYLQLLEQHGIEDAQPTSSLEELYPAASSLPSHSLNAEKTKLYKNTVGALSRMALTRLDVAFAIQQLRQSLGRPLENDEVQLRKVLGYLRGTHAYSTKLQPPRRWTRAKSFDLLAFASTSWTEARKSTFGASLFLMGVPLAASSLQQATRVGAAELTSVGLACAMAAHTKVLLQQLGFDKPMSLAMQLGLSKDHRHVELDSLFGQFQLSKVQVHQDFAAMLTYNPPASGLHWLLPKLKMHIKTAEARALPTVLCEKEAFFLGSPCSFYIGVVRLTPMMAQLDLAQLERTAFEQQLDLAQLERIDLDQLERDQLERIGLDQLERIALEELPRSAYARQL